MFKFIIILENIQCFSVLEKTGVDVVKNQKATTSLEGRILRPYALICTTFYVPSTALICTTFFSSEEKRLREDV